MVQTLWDITEANWDMESKRLDSHIQFHKESMAYIRERDIRESNHKK